VDLDPLSLLTRLCASVPPPRFHTVRYAGIGAGRASSPSAACLTRRLVRGVHERGVEAHPAVKGICAVLQLKLFEGLRLPPSDIAELRYYFNEADIGVRSLHFAQFEPQMAARRVPPPRGTRVGSGR
jgi:hypothetical protein